MNVLDDWAGRRGRAREATNGPVFIFESSKNTSSGENPLNIRYYCDQLFVTVGLGLRWFLNIN